MGWEGVRGVGGLEAMWMATLSSAHLHKRRPSIVNGVSLMFRTSVQIGGTIFTIHSTVLPLMHNRVNIIMYTISYINVVCNTADS